MSYSQIKTAAAYLHEGKLVAFPTETVYGLGANACDDRAVAAIYAAKNRPTFNPLITHVLDMEQAFAYGAYHPLAEKLMIAFWPGPLTIILPRNYGCTLSLLVSAGLDCIALRAPNHPMAQELLRESKLPIAAPSANRSGRLSPTMAEHVEEELGDSVAMVLDGGACKVGIESTVLDMSGDAPVLLRPGSVTRADIEKIIGPIQMAGDGTVKSPGMLESHYAPNAALRLNAQDVQEGEALLAFGPTSLRADVMRNLSPSGSLTDAAANLFSMLRALDKTNITRIAVMPIPMEGLGLAINDRLIRAAAPR